MTKQILLIDSDIKLTTKLSAHFNQNQLSVQCAHQGEEGLKLALNKPFDAIITEVVLPQCNGLKILKAVREHFTLPILFLTGRANSIDTLVALKLGADDYLLKPCDANELLLRLQSVLRRAKHPPNLHLTPILHQNIRLDCNKREVTLRGELLELTNTEFNILEILMKSPGQAFSKEELTEYALGRKFTAFDRSIDVHISNLRSKLGTNQHHEPWINTVRGFGYQFNA